MHSVDMGKAPKKKKSLSQNQKYLPVKKSFPWSENPSKSHRLIFTLVLNIQNLQQLQK